MSVSVAAHRRELKRAREQRYKDRNRDRLIARQRHRDAMALDRWNRDHATAYHAREWQADFRKWITTVEGETT